jgi:Uma2 family endonuclease
MSAATQISVEEYLATAYHPDCDYVDGAVLERNVGEREHSYVQKRLILILGNLESVLGISVWPEVRIQVSARRFRVPDVCVYRGRGPVDPVFRQPPFLCIEILSPEDRMSRMDDKLSDYFSLGVELAWVIDPGRRTASIHTPDGSENVRGGILRAANPEIRIELGDVLPPGTD